MHNGGRGFLFVAVHFFFLTAPHTFFSDTIRLCNTNHLYLSIASHQPYCRSFAKAVSKYKQCGVPKWINMHVPCLSRNSLRSHAALGGYSIYSGWKNVEHFLGMPREARNSHSSNHHSSSLKSFFAQHKILHHIPSAYLSIYLSPVHVYVLHYLRYHNSLPE
ncbi:hypothetical protein GQ43DRAFT_255136 [Delitschia confertaspora ATCC 74209]|uniref:Secreted protein n=1 Tax=Delitschia confertaspora ATCC 74209 TaxID=1513339 RepID=A0A9P4MQZ9_9PLEO|nr:hypothetical protein GQ43DRAFT_255136 [Delitschia confertaspora ATCC 74209]